MTIEDGEYHITRRTPEGDAYGHSIEGCDPSGCAGEERYLGRLFCTKCQRDRRDVDGGDFHLDDKLCVDCDAAERDEEAA